MFFPLKSKSLFYPCPISENPTFTSSSYFSPFFHGVFVFNISLRTSLCSYVFIFSPNNPTEGRLRNERPSVNGVARSFFPNDSTSLYASLPSPGAGGLKQQKRIREQILTVSCLLRLLRLLHHPGTWVAHCSVRVTALCASPPTVFEHFSPLPSLLVRKTCIHTATATALLCLALSQAHVCTNTHTHRHTHTTLTHTASPGRDATRQANHKATVRQKNARAYPSLSLPPGRQPPLASRWRYLPFPNNRESTHKKNLPAHTHTHWHGSRKHVGMAPHTHGAAAHGKQRARTHTHSRAHGTRAREHTHTRHALTHARALTTHHGGRKGRSLRSGLSVHPFRSTKPGG